MSTETTVEKLKGEGLKTALGNARKEKISEFAVGELRSAVDFSQVKQKADAAGVSCGELVEAFESHRQDLERNQAERTSIGKIVDEHFFHGKQKEELAKTLNFRDDALRNCREKTNEHTSADSNPGRRIIAAAVKKSLDSESKNEETNTAPHPEEPPIEN